MSSMTKSGDLKGTRNLPGVWSKLLKCVISGLPCSNMSPDELIDMLEWEFTHLPLIHNLPVTPGRDTIGDDTDLFTTMTNRYLQNVCQRYLMGTESTSHFIGESDVMVNVMHYPPFSDPTHPSLREANDRVMYLSNNW